MTLRTWDYLARRYANLVISVPRGFGLSREDAEDVFQKTWETAMTRCEEPPPELDFVRWIVSIAFWTTRGLLRESRRGTTSVASIDRESERPAPEEVLLQAEREQTVRDALASLSSRDRALLTELFLAPTPASYADLAAQLGVAGGSVGALRARALERLRKALAKRDIFS